MSFHFGNLCLSGLLLADSSDTAPSFFVLPDPLRSMTGDFKTRVDESLAKLQAVKPAEPEKPAEPTK